MAEALKYIIIEDSGLEQAIVFSPFLKHNEVAGFGRMKVVGAGRCSILAPTKSKDWETVTCSKELKVTAWGRSTTMGIDSRPEDADIILQTLKRALD